MKSNTFPLSKPLRNRIQGLAGEFVGLDYALKNLKTDENDSITIVTNRSATIREVYNHLYPSKTHPRAGFTTVHKSPFEFLRHELVNNFHNIGYEGIDLTNADVFAKSLFDKYMSKTKKQILSEFQRNGRLYRKEREKEREHLERTLKAQRDESERRIKERENVDNDNEWYETMFSEFVNTHSHEDLAKVLTLIELEKICFEKEVSSKSAFKISHLNTFKNFFLRNLEWAERDYKNKHNTIKIISEYPNDKFEDWYLFSSVFNSINQTNTKIDSMIVHYHEGKLNKLILIECKTGNAVLSPNQKAFIECLKKIKYNKVEYKKIIIDIPLPEQLTVSEISD